MKKPLQVLMVVILALVCFGIVRWWNELPSAILVQFGSDLDDTESMEQPSRESKTGRTLVASSTRSAVVDEQYQPLHWTISAEDSETSAVVATKLVMFESDGSLPAIVSDRSSHSHTLDGEQMQREIGIYAPGYALKVFNPIRDLKQGDNIVKIMKLSALTIEVVGSEPGWIEQYQLLLSVRLHLSDASPISRKFASALMPSVRLSDTVYRYDRPIAAAGDVQIVVLDSGGRPVGQTKKVHFDAQATHVTIDLHPDREMFGAANQTIVVQFAEDCALGSMRLVLREHAHNTVGRVEIERHLGQPEVEVDCGRIPPKSLQAWLQIPKQPDMFLGELPDTRERRVVLRAPLMGKMCIQVVGRQSWRLQIRSHGTTVHSLSGEGSELIAIPAIAAGTYSIQAVAGNEFSSDPEDRVETSEFVQVSVGAGTTTQSSLTLLPAGKLSLHALAGDDSLLLEISRVGDPATLIWLAPNASLWLPEGEWTARVSGREFVFEILRGRVLEVR
jgi:hypothetical protein